MSENQKHLTMKYIRAKPRRTDAQKRHFRHYMAQIGANFHPESAHESEITRDRITNPRDGSAKPWDGSARTPRPAAFPTLKSGATRTSALTVCHIAHKACEAFRSNLHTPSRRRGGPPRRDAIHRVSPARGDSPATTFYPRVRGLLVLRVAADPIGVALSITAGKRSAPADRNPTLLRPHGGRTSSQRRAGAEMRGMRPWRVTAPRCPRVCLRLTRGNGKLDPHGVLIVGWFLSAGSPAAHPRL